MKKLLLLLIAVCVIGCKKDTVTETPPFVVADYPIELVGEWLHIADKIYDYNIGVNRWSYMNRDTLIFKNDFSYIKINASEPTYGWHGRWKYSKYNVCFMECEYYFTEIDTISDFTYTETLYLLSLKNDTLHVHYNSYYKNDTDEFFGEIEKLYLYIGD